MITDRETILAIVDNDCLMKSDAIILLEGDGFFRVDKAASLYKNGWSQRVLFSGNIVDPDYGSFPLDELMPYLLKKGSCPWKPSTVFTVMRLRNGRQ